MAKSRVDPERWRGPEPWYDRIAAVVRVLAWLLADVAVVHPERLPTEGPVLLAANHVSKLDPPILGTVVLRRRDRVRFIAVSGLFELRMVGAVLRATGMIPVERGAGPERMVADALAALDAGQAVVVYPEGTIPPPGATRPARPGAGLLALEAAARGVPVVPMASWGLDHHGRGRVPRLLRRRVGVAFGPPVNGAAWAGRRDRASQVEVSAALLDEVRALAPEAERAARTRRASTAGP